MRLRYAKRGRLRFASHRDFARAFERALRRAQVPMAYSAGFTPHPKISYVGAAPTGTATEAEYLEIGLVRRVAVDDLVAALDAALPDGLDVLSGVEAAAGSLADRIVASLWRVEFAGLVPDDVRRAIDAVLAAPELLVERVTRDGRRVVDVRGALIRADVRAFDRHSGVARATMDMVVRQVSPAVRPDDVLAALRSVGGLALDPAPGAYPVLRLAQGPLGDDGLVGDPFAPDRVAQPSP